MSCFALFCRPPFIKNFGFRNTSSFPKVSMSKLRTSIEGVCSHGLCDLVPLFYREHGRCEADRDCKRYYKCALHPQKLTCKCHEGKCHANIFTEV